MILKRNRHPQPPTTVSVELTEQQVERLVSLTYDMGFDPDEDFSMVAASLLLDGLNRRIDERLAALGKRLIF